MEVDWFVKLEELDVDAAVSGDELDAHAVLWTARRMTAGDEERLGGERDARGLRMEIVR